jgi:glycosyltransferase involved in cell wall biosynthesis
MTPQVTVLLPVYKGLPYLEAAVRSVLAQSFTDFELLVINDASPDASRELLAAIADPRLRSWRAAN